MKRLRYHTRTCLAILLASMFLYLPVSEGFTTSAKSAISTIAVVEPADTQVAEVSSDAGVAATSANEQTIGYKDYLLKHGTNDIDSIIKLILSEKECVIDETGEITFPVTVQKEGYYNLNFEYKFLEKGNKTDKITVLLDGGLSYKELEKLVLTRLWANSKAIVADEQGNDISPDQMELVEWQDGILHDKEGLFNNPLALFLTAGDHKITLKFDSKLVMLKQVVLNSTVTLPSYDKYLSSHSDATRYNGDNLLIEGETAAFKSEVYLLPQNDVTNPLTTPYNAAKIKLNTFGGGNWKLANEKSTWVVNNVPQTGLYKMTVRFRQNMYEGVSVHRRLYVNGEVPFEEANALEFGYSDLWQSDFIGDYLIYLNQGRNELALECSLGGSAEILAELKQTVLLINSIYRRIIMVTGSVPDNNRDYSLDKQIPDLIQNLQSAYDSLQRVAGLVQNSYGVKSSLVTKIQSVSRQIKLMIDKPRDIAKSDRLGAFKSNISMTGTWLAMFREQPLEIDSFSLVGENGLAPRAAASFSEEVKHRFKRFVASFVEDYSSLGSTTGKTTIKVWLQAGRDQASILKQMITSSFTPVSNIGVNLELVTGSIIEATLAGKGPDVALARADTDPVNFAMRDALVDLSQFEDFASQKSEFADGIFIPFQYNGGVYAVPETMSFSMMFIRNDILKELKIEVPKTWDELVKLAYPVLSRNNMEIGIGAMGQVAQMNSSNIFTNLLYQMGGQIYDDDLLTNALDSSTSYLAFTRAVELYRDYLFPREYDAMSRFRTGEMPILIAPYTMYNVFSITIPELDGLWQMVPIPGIVQTDGSINIAQAATVSDSIIFKAAKDKNACWEFLKWWISADVQTDFGMKVESILGPAGRYSTANLKALTQLPWDENQLAAMETQRKECVYVEQLPGSYFTSRAINSAFMSSVLNGKNPTEQLVYWSEQIDAELSRKRIEFTEGK